MSGVLPLLAAYPASLPPLLVVGPRSLRDWLAEAVAPMGLAGRCLFVHCAEINQPGGRTSSEGEAACRPSSAVHAPGMPACSLGCPSSCSCQTKLFPCDGAGHWARQALQRYLGLSDVRCVPVRHCSGGRCERRHVSGWLG